MIEAHTLWIRAKEIPLTGAAGDAVKEIIKLAEEAASRGEFRIDGRIYNHLSDMEFAHVRDRLESYGFHAELGRFSNEIKLLNVRWI